MDYKTTKRALRLMDCSLEIPTTRVKGNNSVLLRGQDK
jgi:hypothetical protein